MSSRVKAINDDANSDHPPSISCRAAMTQIKSGHPWNRHRFLYLVLIGLSLRKTLPDEAKPHLVADKDFM